MSNSVKQALSVPPNDTTEDSIEGYVAKHQLHCTQKMALRSTPATRGDGCITNLRGSLESLDPKISRTVFFYFLHIN